MLSSISLGSFHYDIALVLRDAKFTNSIPTNSEVWYNMQQKHTDSLEKSDLASELPYCYALVHVSLTQIAQRYNRANPKSV